MDSIETFPGYVAGPVDWSAEFGHVHVASFIDAEGGEDQ